MRRSVSPWIHADNMASGSSNPAKPDNANPGVSATPDKSSDANAHRKTTDNTKNDEASKE